MSMNLNNCSINLSNLLGWKSDTLKEFGRIYQTEDSADRMFSGVREWISNYQSEDASVDLNKEGAKAFYDVLVAWDALEDILPASMFYNSLNLELDRLNFIYKEITSDIVLEPSKDNPTTEDLAEKPVELNSKVLDIVYKGAIDARTYAHNLAKVGIINSFIFNRNPQLGKLGPVDPALRHTYIKNYLQALYSLVVKYLRSKGETIPRAKELLYTIENAGHPNEKVINNFLWILDTFDDYFNDEYVTESDIQSMYEDSDRTDIKGFNAYVMLSNFDSFASIVLGKSLHIMGSEAGLLNGSVDKYRIDTSLMNDSWRNKDEIIIAEEVDLGLQAFIETTPYYYFGNSTPTEQFLRFQDFTSVIIGIKDLAFNPASDNLVIYDPIKGFTFDTISKESKEVISQLIPALLHTSGTVSLSDLINSIREAPSIIMPAIFDILSTKGFWSTAQLLAKDDRIKAKAFRNVIYSIHLGITSYKDTSIHGITMANQVKSPDLVLSFDSIALLYNSLFKTKFLQYYKQDNGSLGIRELQDFQIRRVLDKLGFAIDVTNTTRATLGLKNLESKYGVKLGLERKFNIQSQIFDKFNQVTKFDFQIPIGNKNINVSVDMSNGKVYYLEDGSNSAFDENLPINLSNPSNDDTFEILSFTDKILGLNMARNRVLWEAMKDVKSNEVAKGSPAAKALNDLAGMAARILAQRAIVNLANTINSNYIDLTTAEVINRSTLDNVIGIFLNDGLKPKINTRLGDFTYVTLASDEAMMFSLAEARAIAEGLSTATLVKDGIGSSLSTLTLSRVLGTLLSQYTMLGKLENSAVKNFSFITLPGLFEGIYKLLEAYIDEMAKNHTDFNVAEFSTASFLLDFVEGLGNDKKTKGKIGKGSIGLIPSVNSDKNTIGRLILNLGLKCPYFNKRWIDLTESEYNLVISKELGLAYTKVYDKITNDLTTLNTYINNKLGSKYNIIYENLANLGTKQILDALLKPVTIKEPLFLADGITEASSPRAWLLDWCKLYNLEHPHNILTLYEELHFVHTGKGAIAPNETLLNLLSRFDLNNPSELENFFTIKKAEMLKSALNNGFDLYIPEVFKEGKLIEGSQNAYRIIREKVPNWIDSKDNHFIFAKYTFNDGTVFNLSNKLDILRLNLYMKNKDLLKYDMPLLEDIQQLNRPEIGKLEINPLMVLWNLLDYLFTQEFMLSSVGSHMAHKAKGVVESELQARGISSSEIQLAYEAARFFSLHKRNVAMTAAKHAFLLNLVWGIPTKYNVAVIEDIKDFVHNFAGDTDNAKPYDGATIVNPMIVFLENYSLGAERAGINKKQFGHFYDQELMGAGIIKTAGFGICNDTMRHFLADRRMAKKMMDRKWYNRINDSYSRFTLDGDPAIRYELLTRLNLLKDYDGEAIEYPPLYYKQDGKFYVRLFTNKDGDINAIYNENDGTYTFYDRECIVVDGKLLGTGNIINNGDGVTTGVVDSNYTAFIELFKGYRDTYTDMKSLNKKAYTSEEELFNEQKEKLQDAFSNDVYELDANGKLIHSEKSIAYLAQAACLVGFKQKGVTKVETQYDVWQPMKHSDIHYIITEGAIKQMAANVNDNTSYTSDSPLNWFEIYAYELGIQLDKEHHADGEDLSLMSLVISAVCQRGYSLAEGQAVAEALSALAELGVKEYSAEFSKFLNGVDNEFLDRIKLLILDQLKETSKSDGELINSISTLIHETLIKGGNLVSITLPISDLDIFKKIAGIVSSVLTKTSIRLKLDGILSVLCPSHDRAVLFGDRLLGHWGSIDELLAALIAANLDENLIYNSNKEGSNLARMLMNHNYNIYYNDGRIVPVTFKKPSDRREWVKQMKNGEILKIAENVLCGRNLSHYNAIFKLDDGTECNLYDVDSANDLMLLKEYLDVKDWNSIKDLGIKYKVYDSGIKLRGVPTKQELKDLEYTLRRLFQADQFTLSKSIRPVYNGKTVESFDNLSKDILTGYNLAITALGSAYPNNVKYTTEGFDWKRLSETETIQARKYVQEKRDLEQGVINSINLLLNELGFKELLEDNSEPSYAVQNLLNKFHSLGDGRIRINGEMRVVDRSSILVLPYEVLMPKIYKTALNLNTEDCVAVLKDPELGLEIFKKRLRDKFKSLIKNYNNYDFEFKSLNGLHYYVLHRSHIDDLDRNEFSTKVNPYLKTNEKTGLKYVATFEGKKRFDIASESDEIYKDQFGNEIIVTDDVAFYRDHLKYQTIVYSNKAFNTQDATQARKRTEYLLFLLDFIKGALTSKNKKALKWYNFIALDVLIDLSSNINTLFSKYFNVKNNEIISVANTSNTISGYARFIDELALKMHSAFLMSLRLIAARIPAQSLQSFMAMAIADFIDSDINTAYVSTMLIWLLGSDFDIDAVSLANYSLNSNGEFVGWSNLFDDSSFDRLLWSCNLPYPTGNTAEKTVINQENINDVKDYLQNNIIPELKRIDAINSAMPGASWYGGNGIVNLKTEALFKQFSEAIRRLSELNKFYEFTNNTPKELVNLLEENGLTILQILEFTKVIDEVINPHNDYLNELNENRDDEALELMTKNLLVHNVYTVAETPANLLASLTPIDKATKPYSNISKLSPGYKEIITFTPGNVFNKILAININLVGKDGIAICAVGMKAFFAATQYNNLLLEKGNEMELARLLFNDSENYLWDAAKIKRELMDVMAEDEQIYDLPQLLANVRAKNPDSISNADVVRLIRAVNNDTDAAVVLSALMSLATDNAKELCLGNLNAGLKLLPLYLFGIAVGLDFRVINKLLTSELGYTIRDLFEGNFVTNSRGMYNLEQVFNYLIEGPLALLIEYDKWETKLDGKNSATLLLMQAIEQYINKSLGYSEGSDPWNNLGISGLLKDSNKLARFAHLAEIDENGNNIEGFTIENKIKFLDELRAQTTNVHLALLINKVEGYLFQVQSIYINPITGFEEMSYTSGVDNNTYGIRRSHTNLDRFEWLARGAAEMTDLGRILSINNGIKYKIELQVLFIENIENAIVNRKKAKESYKHRKWSLGNRASKEPTNPYPTTFDFTKFLYDTEYANRYIQEYDLVKHSLNILDIIDKSKQYKSFLKTAVLDFQAMKASSVMYRSGINLANRAIKLLHATTVKDKTSIYNRSFDLVSDILFLKWLTLNNYKLSIHPGDKYFKYLGLNPILETNDTDKDLSIDLGTDAGLATFKYWMENSVIPDLQLGTGKYTILPVSGNKFILNLGPTITDRNTLHLVIQAYTLNLVNMLPREDSERSQLNSYRVAFNKLNSVLINSTPKGSPGFTIKEALWLYNMISFYGKKGEQTLTTIFDGFKLGDSMADSFKKFISEYDRNNDVILGIDVSEEKLLLWTTPVGSLWSSNLNYIYNLSRDNFRKEFMTKNVEMKYGSQGDDEYADELYMSDYDDPEMTASDWALKARYSGAARFSDYIQYGIYQDYFSRGHLDKLVNYTFYRSVIPFGVTLAKVDFELMLGTYSNLIINPESLFEATNLYDTFVNNINKALNSIPGLDYAQFKKLYIQRFSDKFSTNAEAFNKFINRDIEAIKLDLLNVFNDVMVHYLDYISAYNAILRDESLSFNESMISLQEQLKVRNQRRILSLKQGLTSTEELWLKLEFNRNISSFLNGFRLELDLNTLILNKILEKDLDPEYYLLMLKKLKEKFPTLDFATIPVSLQKYGLIAYDYLILSFEKHFDKKNIPMTIKITESGRENIIDTLRVVNNFIESLKSELKGC